MFLIPLFSLWGCTVGLVNETKPVDTEDSAIVDTAVEPSSETSTEPSDDTTDTNTQPTAENPYNGECGDGIDNDNDGRTDCQDTDCVAAPECNTTSNDSDSDGYPDDQDCNPYNPYVYPGATEIPGNGIDDDCDGVTDSGGSTDTGGTDTGGQSNPTGMVCSDTCTDGLGGLLYGAMDGNCQDGGFGDFVSMIAGSSFCAFGTDCTDCGMRTDADNDGHEADPLGLGLALYADCNDADPNINSSATDIPGNGIDEDCDGADATSGSGSSGTTCYVDNDGDGYGTTSTVASSDSDCNDAGESSVSTDCNDGNASINPAATDIPGNGVDEDCSGSDASSGSSGGSTVCSNTCFSSSGVDWNNDGWCDDGGGPSLIDPSMDTSSACDFGTDCGDCGARPVCSDTCVYANDNVCDDDELGGTGDCDRGTDCSDCGSY